MHTWAKSLAIGLLLASIAACSGETEGPVFLIGKWQGNGDVYVFSPGGGLERLDPTGRSIGTGSWSVRGEELALTIDPTLNAVCGFTVDNVTLSLTPSERCRFGTATLRRIPN